MTKQEKLKQELKLENRVLTTTDGKIYEYVDYELQLLIQISKVNDIEMIDMFHIDCSQEYFIELDYYHSNVGYPLWHVSNALNQYYHLKP